MAYPVLIDTKDLMSYLKGKKEVAWVLINEKGELISKGGNESVFGLDIINLGQRLADHYICLEGLFPLAGEPHEIYELELVSEKFVNVYCLPTEKGDKVIFQDITEMTVIKNVVHEKVQEIIVFIDNYKRNIS